MKKPLAMIFAATLALSACSSTTAVPSPGASGSNGGSSTSVSGGNVVLPVNPEPKSLNPDWANDGGGYYPSGNIYSHLVILDWGAVSGTEAYGDLAKSWDQSPDGKTYTFHLRSGVQWQDGQPLTSADIVYTYQTIIDKKYPLAAYLKGATITAPDDLTVVISFTAANVAFVPLLAQASNWYGAILPKHIYDGTDWTTNPANLNPIGSGPFKFVSWNHGSSITLMANPAYYLGRPKINQLTFQFVQDPQVAMAGFNSGQYQDLPYNYATNYQQIAQLAKSGSNDPIVVQTPSLYDRSIYINLKNSILSNLKVRQALAYGVDRESMNQLAFAGLWQPTYNASISSFPQFANPNATFPHFDLTKAKQLLDQAGYPVGADGTRFTLHVTGYTAADSVLIVQVLVQQLKALEINAVWDQYDLATWTAKQAAGQYDLSIYFVRYGPDPAAYAEHFGTNGPRNFTGYSNAQVDQWLTQGAATTDAATRKQLYDEVQQQLATDIPYIPLFTEHKYSLVHKGWDGFPEEQSAYNRSMGWFSYYDVHQTQ